MRRKEVLSVEGGRISFHLSHPFAGNHLPLAFFGCLLSLWLLVLCVCFWWFFPKAAAKGSFEKSVAIKDCHSGLSSNIAQSKDCQ